ncbi:MAG: type II toxin-antitoxin system HicA family toxin [Nitrospirae bacterium]|nr:type II toxin-antitoxin system HicA family toxin [Nitrospirota bacterium]
MGKIDKLINRFLSKPKDFTFDELVILLRHYGYDKALCGKTGGSRAAFKNVITKHVLRLHKPHPGQILKPYQVTDIINSLKETGVLK